MMTDQPGEKVERDSERNPQHSKTMIEYQPHKISRRGILKKGAVVSSVLGIGAGTATAHRGALEQQLAEVRSTTARYKNPANAYADDYTATDAKGNPVALEDVQEEALAVCGMGYHFLNFEIIRGLYGGADAQRQQPPILVYGVGDSDDLVLGAVEYLASEPQSSLFHGDEDDSHWEPWLPDTDLSALHAWVHNHNPDGIFHPTNPRELFHPEGCIGGH